MKRDYSKYDEYRLITDIRSINWEVKLTNTDDVTFLFDSFYTGP